jgi:ribosomal protein S18 acetylase RimI-like enzyme
MSVEIAVTTSHIRRLNVREDLSAVADLIEICFASTLDADGREYLRHLRWAARDAHYLSWLQNAAERLASPLYGYVWEESGRIVGNLSLIPIYRSGRITFLIANVAVHPDYRRRGIAHQLTERALEYVRQRGNHTVWLQVRVDNPAAYARTRRTTWHSHHPVVPILPAGVTIQKRQGRHWPCHSHWLAETYPAEVAWNLSFSLSRFSPNIMSTLVGWLRGERREHWVARNGARPLGFVSWEAVPSLSDILWVAVSPEQEERVIQPLLAHVQQSLAGRNRNLSINYPAGRAREAFFNAGFVDHQTLIWMEAIR